MTRAVRARAWRYTRRVDDDDDEITVCVQLICLMISLLPPPRLILHVRECFFFYTFFSYFCLLAGLGRLGIFFKKKRAFVWGASTARFIVPLLLPTAFYIRTLIFLMQWWELKPLCDVGCWLGPGAFLFSFSKKNCCTDGLDLVSFYTMG